MAHAIRLNELSLILVISLLVPQFAVVSGRDEDESSGGFLGETVSTNFRPNVAVRINRNSIPSGRISSQRRTDVLAVSARRSPERQGVSVVVKSKLRPAKGSRKLRHPRKGDGKV